ncbi:hypothetical protein [Nocardia sp. NPDC057030]|uniref:hypothetical protein n=1 Tax=Nocardia sp. NPDC057030 TaxID=3346005 RepID=UPI0036398041
MVALAGFAKAAGLVIITIISIYVLLAKAAVNKLSVGTTISVVGAAIVAGVAVYYIPSLINYSRYDFGTIVPEYPIGVYR